MIAIVAAAGVAAILAAALSGLLARSGPVDGPRDRGSHVSPTPTAGGLAILAATAAGCAITGALGRPSADDLQPMAVLLALSAAIGAFGALDDLFDLGPGVKLTAQIIVAVVASCGVAHLTALPIAPGLELPLGSLLGALGGALFLVLLLNAMNFMDGANGLASGVTVIALSSLAAAALLGDEPVIGALAVAGAAAGAGFLPWNLSGRLFQGDAGAFFSALLVGGVGITLAAEGATTPYLVVFCTLPLLVDVLMTLAVRALRRAPLARAHREHLYQLWLAADGRTHGALAWRVWLLTAACALLGFTMEQVVPRWSLAALAAMALALSGGWLAGRCRLTAR